MLGSLAGQPPLTFMYNNCRVKKTVGTKCPLMRGF